MCDGQSVGSFSDYLHEIENKVVQLIERHKKYSDSDHLIAFRGEKKDYGKTKLMPSLFRDKDYVSKERYLFELLGDYNFLEKGTDRNIDDAIEAQHYIAISRMLDITFSLLPAMYFACGTEEANSDSTDAFIYIFCFPDYYSPHSQYIERLYTGVLDETTIGSVYSSNFKVISHSYSNARIKAQVGGFIFFPGKEYKPIPSIYYEKVRIKAEHKEKIARELDLLFHVNEATLFPEKEKMIPIIEKKFKEGIYHKREIGVPDEVDTFFERFDYEIKMELNGTTKKDKMGLLRRFRKEESDLLYFIEQNFQMGKIVAEQREELRKKVKDTFQFLRLKYGGK